LVLIYGITNADGPPNFEQARGIVSAGWNAEIVLFDTADDESLKAKGLVEFRVISAYEAADGKFALGLKHFDMVQPPLNAFDRTAVDEGVNKETQRTSKLLFFRIAFLQGILLTLRTEQISNRMSFVTKIPSEWAEVCQGANLPANRLALHIETCWQWLPPCDWRAAEDGGRRKSANPS
jgi:hypothetical protein